MFSPNIEQAVNYSSLPPSLMPSRGSSEGRRDTAKHCCGKLMWRLINCFRSQEQEQIRPRYAYYAPRGVCLQLQLHTQHLLQAAVACCCTTLLGQLRTPVPCANRRPVIVEAHIAQYQAPVVTPSPRAGSVSSCDEDQDFERGTLLPKVCRDLLCIQLTG
jgi:hypothetical protein